MRQIGKDTGVRTAWLAEGALRLQACVGGRRGVLLSPPSTCSTTSLLWVTDFPAGTLWYSCLISSPAGASVHGVSSAVLKRRKGRKGFTCSSVHAGSRVEEMRPALQARWGPSFVCTLGKICSMPVNWTGSCGGRKGKERDKRLNRWREVKLAPLENLHSRKVWQSHFIS